MGNQQHKLLQKGQEECKKLEQVGLEGLYNLNRGQSCIKFCLKSVGKKTTTKKASLENVVEFHCAAFQCLIPGIFHLVVNCIKEVSLELQSHIGSSSKINSKIFLHSFLFQ